MIFSNKLKGIDLFLSVVILLYPWFFLVLQGIDLADEGFWLVAYQNFFHHPEVSQTIFSCWLTVFFGALVDTFFGKMGLLSFKIAYVFVLYLSLLLVYVMLKQYVSRTFLLFTLLLAMMLANLDTLPIVHYYKFTALFYLIAGAFLYFGLIKKRNWFIFLSGVFLGMNIFIRFPNLLGIGLIFAIFYYNWAKKSLRKVMFQQSLSLLLGYLSGLSFIVLLMYSQGHFHIYLENISRLLAHSKDPSYHHSGSKMLITLLKSHLIEFRNGLIFLTGLFFLTWMSRFWSHPKFLKWFFAILFSVMATLFFSIKGNYSTAYYFHFYPGIYGVVFILLLWIAYKSFRQTPEFGVLALIAFFIMELIPLGSNTGLLDAKYGFYLAIPIVLIYIYSLHEVKFNYLVLKKEQLDFLKTFVSTFLLIFPLVVGNLYFPSYEDGKYRWEMRYTVNHPLLANNFTTKERAEALDTLLEKLNMYLPHYGSLLAYERLALIYYVTEASPFLDTSWPYLMPPSALKKKIIEKQKKKGLPLVVRAKNFTTYKEWPKIAKPLPTYSSLIVRDREILQKFLNEHNYQTVWEDRNFEILIPSQQIKKRTRQ